MIKSKHRNITYYLPTRQEKEDLKQLERYMLKKGLPKFSTNKGPHPPLEKPRGQFCEILGKSRTLEGAEGAPLLRGKLIYTTHRLDIPASTTPV
jgi:hypothetical protein